MERLLRRAARRGDQDGHNGMTNRRSNDSPVSTSAVLDIVSERVNEGRVPVSYPELPSPWWSSIVKRLVIAFVRRLQAFDCTDRLIRGCLEIAGLLSGCCEVATKSRRQERHGLQRVRKLVDRLLEFVIHRPPVWRAVA